MVSVLNGLLFVFCFAWSFYPNIEEIVVVWATNPDFSHGFVVVPENREGVTEGEVVLVRLFGEVEEALCLGV